MNTDFIHRSLGHTLLEAAPYFPVLCVTGPRQSGKSTLVNHLFADYKRFSMEDIDVRSAAMSDPRQFLNQTSEGMIIDEVQRVPELLSYIQGIVDNNPERRFVLTGSSNFALLRSVSQSLAGRVGMFELLPMAFEEVREDMDASSLDEILYNGLYPAVCAGKSVARFLYPSYVKTYLERDVRDLLQVRNLMQFNTFLRLCASRIGSLFNASELASEVGVDSKTITSWLSILQTSYIVFLLPPYYANTRKRLVKSPKLYFCDTGLACYLLDIESPEQLSRDKMRGHLFENFIVMEALKHRYNAGRESNLFFYRDSNNNEIDLLMLTGQKADGYEIKSAATYHPSFAAKLEKMPSYVKAEVGRRAVIYTGTFEREGAEIEIRNWRNFLRTHR
ncbi:MAG: ATP-binding protein [Alloprevotella sp.]|nr:ATP-binding protein [Alloprevotella sp.]